MLDDLVKIRRQARDDALMLLLRSERNSSGILATLDEYLRETGLPRPPRVGYAVRLIEGIDRSGGAVKTLLRESWDRGASMEQPAALESLVTLLMYEFLFIPDIGNSETMSEARRLAELHCASDVGSTLDRLYDIVRKQLR